MQTLESLSPNLATFWRTFVATTSTMVDESRFLEAFAFGDSEALADELAKLLLWGTKRATAAGVWTFEGEGKRMPRPGDLSIVTTWAGEPVCVIETRSVVVVPFREVTAEFAAIEGEGDGSLVFWREARASRARVRRRHARGLRVF